MYVCTCVCEPSEIYEKTAYIVNCAILEITFFTQIQSFFSKYFRLAFNVIMLKDSGGATNSRI